MTGNLSNRTREPDATAAPRTSRARLAVLVLLYAVCACIALYAFVRPPGMDAYGKARFGDTIYGRAWRPFAGRVLLPWTVRGIVAATPEPANQAIARRVRALFNPDGEPNYIEEYPYEFAVTVLLLFACLLGFALSLRRLGVLALERHDFVPDLVPAAALLVLPTTYLYMSYVYDFPNLFLFTLGLVLVFERRTTAFCLVLALASANKETAILLTLVWLLTSGTAVPLGRRFGLAVLQVLIWAGIRAAIELVYRHNPGATVEWWHLRGNLMLAPRILSNFVNRPLLLLLRQWGPKLVALAALVGFFAGLKQAPWFLKRAAWIGVPLFALALFMGSLEEARAFYELYPIALLVLVSGILKLGRKHAQDSQARNRT
ncbi:MAG: hypothetical protein JSU73_06150 [candidate division WOR-3 bacterium]|nr:MAG: hypothetical protein JSU73_06150 [candidate division WOR-3 bacterium]